MRTESVLVLGDEDRTHLRGATSADEAKKLAAEVAKALKDGNADLIRMGKARDVTRVDVEKARETLRNRLAVAQSLPESAARDTFVESIGAALSVVDAAHEMLTNS